MKWVVATGVAAGAALIYLLSQASANTALFTRHYAWLFGLAGVVSLALMVLIGYQVAALIKKLRNHAFGALLTVRLAGVFVLMALIPGALLYALSVQFLDRSIESWFEVRVDKALEAGLNLGRAALDQQLKELAIRGEGAAADLAAAGSGPLSVANLAALRERGRHDMVALYTSQGVLLAASGQSATEPVAQMALAAGRERVVQRAKEELPDSTLALRVALLLPPIAPEENRVLVIEQRLSREASAEAQRVEAGYRDYQELSLFRTGLKRLFAVTLTLAMLLTLFSAIALSFVLSERISAPLSALADATRAVAAGDYSRFNPVLSHDEFGVLTQSFNTMTQRIADATAATERQQQALAATNSYLEGILSNLTSGVLTFDGALKLRTANDAAARLIEVPRDLLAATPLSAWASLADPAAALAPLLAKELANPRVHWEKQMTVAGNMGERTLFVRGTRLAAEAATDAALAARGHVVVFDDITHLKEAERSAAWGEVARRLAHEIKNPLTPIQLSAERLQHKLEAKLGGTDAEMLKRATGTIVAQVGALKAMVDDFGQYARATAPRFGLVDLSALVAEVLTLYEAMPAALHTETHGAFTPMEADAALLRQTLHNLMQNAQDALSGIDQPRIDVTLIAAADHVTLTVADNGCGIAASVLPRIFEPYVTTKAKGTGLGLAIVKRIVDLHHGEITIQNRAGGGGVSVAIQWPLKQPASILEDAAAQA
jgi:nitrogen fixation/metabolism regulation signal transduction histidine kinase